MAITALFAHRKVATATVARPRRPAAAQCWRILWVPHPSFSRVRFFITWPGRRNGARPWRVHRKDEGTAAGLKTPFEVPSNSGQVRASPSIRIAPLRASRRYIKRAKVKSRSLVTTFLVMTSEDTAKVPMARNGKTRRGALGYKSTAAKCDGRRIGCGCPTLRS